MTVGFDVIPVTSSNPGARSFPLEVGIYKADWLKGKSKIINKAIQDIGMGRYQWQLFVLCGFGWLADK